VSAVPGDGDVSSPESRARDASTSPVDSDDRDGWEWVALIVLLACWLAEASLGAG
jgi:hypothetical protein